MVEMMDALSALTPWHGQHLPHDPAGIGGEGRALDLAMRASGIMRA
jgi:hypothetical protein